MNGLVKYKNCEFTKSKLVIADTTTKAEWEKIGYGLSEIHSSNGIWIGDWIRFGSDKKYTDSKIYDEIVEITHIDRRTLQNYKSIAENTSELRESSSRDEDIPFTVYKELAPLEIEKQNELLDTVIDKKLSTRELHKVVMKEKHPHMGSSTLSEPYNTQTYENTGNPEKGNVIYNTATATIDETENGVSIHIFDFLVEIDLQNKLLRVRNHGKPVDNPDSVLEMFEGFTCCKYRDKEYNKEVIINRKVKKSPESDFSIWIPET